MQALVAAVGRTAKREKKKIATLRMEVGVIDLIFGNLSTSQFSRENRRETVIATRGVMGTSGQIHEINAA